MPNDEIKRIVEGPEPYDDTKEDTLRSMIGDFYNRKMISTIILTWAYGLAFIALAVYSAVSFFRSETVKDLTMFAAIFVSSIIFISMVKIWAWQVIHRNSIKREIKRLEIRLAELSEAVRKQ